MTEERTRDLIKLWQENVCLKTPESEKIVKQSSDELILGHTPLAIHIARAYSVRAKSHDTQDLIQEGITGLYDAIERFDLSFGVKFCTYAGWWIRQKIIYALKYRDRVVHVPPASGVESFRQVKLSPNTLARESTDIDNKIDAANLTSKLTPKQKTIIEGHFFKGLTVKDVGKTLGISRERARQIKEKALCRMAKGIKWSKLF